MYVCMYVYYTPKFVMPYVITLPSTVTLRGIVEFKFVKINRYLTIIPLGFSGGNHCTMDDVSD